jgi:hypothetical protein
MAEKIVLETEIKTGNSTASVKSVKAELRQLKAEMAGLEIGSAEFTKLAQRAGQLEDAIGDANAAVKAFNPEAKFQAFAGVLGGVANGFSAAQGAMALFGSESEDINKIMVQTQGAIALATGVNGLLGMKDAFIILGNVIKTQVVSAFATMRAAIISTGIIALVAVIGTLIYQWVQEKEANEEATKELERFGEAQRKLLDQEQKIQIEREKGRKKEILQASAETQAKIREYQKELEEKKITQQEFNRLLAGEQELMRIKVAEINKKYDEEEDKKAKELADKRKAEREKQREEEEKRFNQRIENLKKELEAESAVADAALKRSRAAFDESLAKINAREEEEKKLREGLFKLVNDETQSYQIRQQALDEYLKAGYISQKEYSDASIALTKAEEIAKLNSIQMVSNALSGFIALAGEQTAAGKALAVAQTTIDTYVAAVRAYKSALDVPVIGTYLAPVAAASAVAAGLANVRRILSVQVPGGGGGGGSVPSAPNMSVPRMTATGNQVSGAGAVSLNSQPQTKVYVVESDIRRVQNKVEVIENNARIG